MDAENFGGHPPSPSYGGGSRPPLWLIGFGWIPVRIRRDGRQVVAFGLQLGLDLFDGSIELLIFTFELFRGIVIHHDVGIDAVAFDDPLFAILRIRRELGPEELA